MSHEYQMPTAPMLPFALVLKQPSIAVGDERLDIGWKGTGPFGVPILARGDGVIIFDFPATERFAGPTIPGYQPIGGQRIPSEVVKAQKLRAKVAYARLQYMNSWFAGYMSAMSFIQKHGIITPPPVDPANHMKAQLHGERWLVFNNDLESVSGDARGKQVNLDVFEYAVNVMKEAQEMFGENFASPLSLFYQSSHQYRIHQFASSHLTSWSLCEQVLNTLWKQYQLDVSSGPNSVTSISKKRRETLNGRDYSAAIITQILSLAGRIPDERMEKLDQARKDRNAFAHSLSPIDGEKAQNAMLVATEMLSDLLGIRLSHQLSNLYWI